MSLLIREYLSSAVNALSNFAYHEKRLFPTQLPSEGSINMVKGLLLRLQKSFDPCTIFPLEGSSQAGLVRHLSNHIFRGQYFWKNISYVGSLFLENVEDLT